VRKPRLFHAVALVFVLWNALSLLWSVDPQATATRLFTFLQLLALIYMLWDTLRTAAALDAALQAYVLGAWVTVLSLIGNHLAYGPIGYQDRFSTGTFQLDDLGLILALGIPSAWYLAVYARSGRVIRALRAVNFAYVPTGVVAIMLTGSRAALVSVAASLVYMVVSLFRVRRAVGTAALAMAAVLFVVLQPLVPPQTLERLGTTGREVAEGDLEGRVPIWREALVTFRDHPLLGVGGGAFRSADSGKVAHNFVMRSLAELGLVGFALFCGLLVVTAAHVPGQPTGLMGLWWSVLATWLIGASLYNFENKKQTWLFFTLVVVGRSLSAFPSPHAAGAGGGQRKP
jgi:O-antigen ligase